MEEVAEVGGGLAAARAGARWSILSHFLFELFELPGRGGFARRPIHVRFQQLVAQIRSFTRAAGFLDVAPGLLRAGLRRRGRLELRLHVIQLALPQSQFLALCRELALQHAGALTMLRGKAIRDRHGLLVPDLTGEPAAPFRVREPLALEPQLAFGARNRFPDFGYGNLGVDERLTHLARERSQIGRGRRSEGGAKSVPQALEQGTQLLRTVFAKKSEKTGSTARDLHLGHTGRDRGVCCVIDSVRANRY